MKKVKLITGVIVILAIAYIVASPYITVYQMKRAADNRDGETLAEHVDFPALRQSLKDQMNARMAQKATIKTQKDPLAAMGVAFGGLIADKMVDAYVTPVSIARLINGEKPVPGQRKNRTSDKPDPFADVSLAYESLNKFAITSANANGEAVKFILKRKGISWKLSEVVLPLNGGIKTWLASGKKSHRAHQ